MRSSADIYPAFVCEYKEGDETYRMNPVSIASHSAGGPFEHRWNQGAFEIVSLDERVWAIVRVLTAAVNLGMDRTEVLAAMRAMDEERKGQN